MFITHFHADHVLGLPGMLKTFALMGRERRLVVHGPVGLRRLFATLHPVIGRTAYEVELSELEPGDELRARRLPGGRLRRGPPRPAVGYALIEDERPGALRRGTRAGAGSASRGPTSGACSGARRWTEVEPDQVLGEARRGRTVVLTGDTAPCEMTRAVAHQADLLVHEATFLARGGRPRDRDGSLHRARCGPAGGRGGGGAARAHAPVVALRRRRRPRRGPRGVRAHDRAARLRPRGASRCPSGVRREHVREGD